MQAQIQISTSDTNFVRPQFPVRTAGATECVVSHSQALLGELSLSIHTARGMQWWRPGGSRCQVAPLEMFASFRSGLADVSVRPLDWATLHERSVCQWPAVLSARP